MPQPVLYLDVDDCLAADYAGRVWSGETVKLTVTQKLGGGFGMVRHTTFSYALLDALNQVVQDFGVELVWHSSWCEDLLVARKLVPKFRGVLTGGRVTPYPCGEDGELGLWKRDALLRDQASDERPFVWVDDTEVPEYGDEVRTLTTPTPSLLIAPVPGLGLTPAHVELMREFYASLA
ncbi:HAD domain-containing protein [Curtobacterium sp. MCBD17_040]|uniref:HAD domain-containing protein n=1 Tax=Curtobacterium sp. MCBD17_040 TaxID=2175674 RepID=UPI000DA81B5E|nr:HAD domain-containing protein [Curtobacterium sp. MCBD17_040]WIB65442.1 HAD domain-containing protein [Curtobacterium sp. MCBD17_040]